MKSEKQLQEEREESLGYDNSKSLNPERDELWAKHDGLTPTRSAMASRQLTFWPVETCGNFKIGWGTTPSKRR